MGWMVKARLQVPALCRAESENQVIFSRTISPLKRAAVNWQIT